MYIYIYTYVHPCVYTHMYIICTYLSTYKPHIYIYIHIISQVPETLVTGIGVDATLNHRSAAQGGFWMGGRRTLHAAAEQHEASWSIARWSPMVP